MTRRIITTQLQATDSAQTIDTYTDKLIKFIPADVVAAWTAVSGLIAGATNEPRGTLLWISFLVGLAVSALWTWRQTSLPGQPPALTQTAISTLAFGVWVFALGGPFNFQAWYSPLYGSLLLIAFTLIVPLINPPES